MVFLAISEMHLVTVNFCCVELQIKIKRVIVVPAFTRVIYQNFCPKLKDTQNNGVLEEQLQRVFSWNKQSIIEEEINLNHLKKRILFEDGDKTKLIE